MGRYTRPRAAARRDTGRRAPRCHAVLCDEHGRLVIAYALPCMTGADARAFIDSAPYGGVVIYGAHVERKKKRHLQYDLYGAPRTVVTITSAERVPPVMVPHGARCEWPPKEE